MRGTDFRNEAESCRRQAMAYLGQPECVFLLRVARAFDDLAFGSRSMVWTERAAARLESAERAAEG